MPIAEVGFFSFGASLLMSFIWLAFWLMEDRCSPEPKFRIALTFIAGMVAVALVLPIEEYARMQYFGLALIVIWALTEEVMKLAAAWAFGLGSKAYDEPVDAVIYMVTAALGFAAAENTLFILGQAANGALLESALTGDQRFIGATLLHILASASIGLTMAYAFYKTPGRRFAALIGGVILAVGLHSLFNFLILQADGAMTLSAFLSIWFGIIVVLFLIERVKHPTRELIQT